MADKHISVEAFTASVRERYCKNCDRRKGMKNGKLKTVYAIGDAPCRSCGIDDMLDDIDDYPPADVVARDCFNRILAENDTMREQLASIGKKPGDSMNDVRRVVGHTGTFGNRDGEVERITIHDNEPDAIIFRKNENGGYIVKTVPYATSDKNGNGNFVTVLSENAMIESVAYREDNT